MQNLSRELATSVRISEANLKELHKMRGEIESKKGRFTTMDEALSEIIQGYKKRRK